jgi:glutamine amidotransferase
MIGVVDIGISNVGSVINMFKFCGHEAVPVSSISDIDKCKKLVIPGVGSYDTGMRSLKESGLFEILNKKALVDRIPILGICLGMQIMCLSSEEGIEDGLGWINARVKSFKSIKNPPRILPHMGWNKVECRKESKLTYNFNDDTRFYFVHSYFVDCLEPSDVLLSTEYGMNFASAFNVGNIYGVQFHPEKSHLFGAKLMTRFGEL